MEHCGQLSGQLEKKPQTNSLGERDGGSKTICNYLKSCCMETEVELLLIILQKHYYILYTLIAVLYNEKILSKTKAYQK